MSKIKLGMSLIRQKIPSRINPKSLGYIQPNGIINFQTAQSAETYAKNRVLAALKCPKPFERGIELKGTRILGEADGDAFLISSEVAYGILHEEGSKLVHGHPSYCRHGSLPLSMIDFFSMVSNEFSNFIAYNKAGEYNSLTRKPKKWFLRILPKKLSNKFEQMRLNRDCNYAINLYAEMLKPIYPKKYQPVIEPLCHYTFKPVWLGVDSKKAQLGEQIVKALDEEELIKLYETEQKAMTQKESLKIIHNFWQKFEKHTGNFEYSTNFSNLIN